MSEFKEEDYTGLLASLDKALDLTEKARQRMNAVPVTDRHVEANEQNEKHSNASFSLVQRPPLKRSEGQPTGSLA